MYILTSPPMPTTPTVFPGPAPLRTSGEKTVNPAQSIEHASSDEMASGIGNMNCSWAIMPVE